MRYKTPSQRKKIYQKMVKEIEMGNFFFLCNRIYDLTRGKLKYDFPELWDLRPAGEPFCWYDLDKRGMSFRKRKLLTAIKNC
jgi:hypothetical protein